MTVDAADQPAQQPRRSRCPTCHTAGIPVIYGLPGSELVLAAEEGLVALGGCIVRGDENSTWRCPECEDSFLGPATKQAVNEAIRRATDRLD